MPKAKTTLTRITTLKMNYGKPGAHISDAFKPQLPHLADGSQVLDAYVSEAGRYCDGTEYQKLLVIIKPPEPTDA